MGGPGSGRRKQNNNQGQMAGLFFIEEPKIEEHDAMLMWRKGYKVLRDDSRTNLEKRLGGLRRNKNKMIRRIENAFIQIKQMEVAERVYYRELERLKSRNQTISTCYFFENLDTQLFVQKEKMR